MNNLLLENPRFTNTNCWFLTVKQRVEYGETEALYHYFSVFSWLDGEIMAIWCGIGGEMV